ncbi:unnamed protein product [Discosporangium mesarthrocarpum]
MRVPRSLFVVSLLAPTARGIEATEISSCRDLSELERSGVLLVAGGRTKVVFSENTIECDKTKDPKEILVDVGHTLQISDDGKNEVTLRNVRFIVKGELFVEPKITFEKITVKDIRGGAISVIGNSSKVRFEDNTTFRDIDGAIRGGAIAIARGARVDFKKDVNFKDVKARVSGGAVVVNDRSSMKVEGNASFKDCSSLGKSLAGETDEDFPGSGGAMLIRKNSRVDFKKEAKFKDNKSVFDGGAVTVLWKSIVIYRDKTVFKDNKTKGDGGAIYIDFNSASYFEGDTEFKDNLAQGYGGAISVFGRNSEMEFFEKVLFKDNKANLGSFARYQYGYDFSYGGQLAVVNRGKVRFMRSSDVDFEGGEADFGGAIGLLDKGKVSVGGKASFKKNVSMNCGGAIAATSKSKYDDEEATKVTFSGNKDKNDDKSKIGDCDNKCFGTDKEKLLVEGGAVCN